MAKIYEYVLEQLQRRKGDWVLIANETGLSVRTIQKIAREEIPNPGIRSVELLFNHFQRKRK
jgi:hypothetical protein